MSSFNFWQKWLFAVSSIMAALGLFIALFNRSQIFDCVFNNQINPTFWIENAVVPGIIDFQSWIYGVLGATVTGWGILMAFIAKYPFKEKQKWSWNCLALATILWFVVDTSISIYFRVYFNAVFNTILFLAITLPLLFTRRYFIPAARG